MKQGVVKFDKPICECEDCEADILEDFYSLGRSLKDKVFNELEDEQFDNRELDFEAMKNIFHQAGISDQAITALLIIYHEKAEKKYQEFINETEQHKLKNKLMEEVCVQIRCLPSVENTEKIIRYEKAIQKSILQNLSVLKRLQSLN